MTRPGVPSVMPEPDAEVQRERTLAKALAALASPVRLALLRRLRAPQALGEIRVRAEYEEHGGDDDRLISRQGVREHLDKLLAIGAVRALDEDGRVDYVLNHQTIYRLSEDLRELARLRPLEDGAGLPTVARPRASRKGLGDAPMLVLVKGLDEGRVFDLTPSGPKRQWTIGRRRGLDVALDFDPFVSSENALIEVVDGAYVLTDLPGSRNGTTLNFEPLDPAERRPLARGDVVGVGRSLLLFRG